MKLLTPFALVCIAFVSLASTTPGKPDSDQQFHDRYVAYTSSADDPNVGKNLAVRLNKAPNGWADFDNVRIYVSKPALPRVPSQN